MRYRMIGVDLDGTLLNRRGQVSAQNLLAIEQAQSQGVMVVTCTGRAWREARLGVDKLVSRQLLGTQGVFVGGAAVCDLVSGQSLDLAMIEPGLAMSIVDHLQHGPDAVLVFQDWTLSGRDYLVVGDGKINGSTRWWFDNTGAKVAIKPRANLEDMKHTLRIGIVAPRKRTDVAVARIKQELGDSVVVHSFEAVAAPDPENAMHLVEIFSAGVNKWRGLLWLAGQQGIEPAQVAVIGDEINDLAMMRGAGCAIAMGNAVQAVKEVSDHVTLDCDEHGAGHAIEQILAGRWG